MGGTMPGNGGGLLDGYQNLRDVFNGGGPGRSGNKFQGGGLLSALANSIAKPLGYNDRRTPQASLRPMARPVAQPVMATGGPRAVPASGPMPSAGPGPAVMSQGPEMGAPSVPESPIVGVPTMRAPQPMAGGVMSGPEMGVPDASPNVGARDIVAEFEAYLESNPQSAALADMLNNNPDAAYQLLRQWVRNGKKLPGM